MCKWSAYWPIAFSKATHGQTNIKQENDENETMRLIVYNLLKDAENVCTVCLVYIEKRPYLTSYVL